MTCLPQSHSSTTLCDFNNPCTSSISVELTLSFQVKPSKHITTQNTTGEKKVVRLIFE